MTRAEYIRKRRNNRRKHKILTCVKRCAIGVVLGCCIVTAGCGGVYVHSYFQEEEQQMESQAAQKYAAMPMAGQDEAEKPEGAEMVLNTVQGHVGSTVQSEPAGQVGSPAQSAITNGQDAVEKDFVEEKITVVLDAGHGGNDGGTFSGDIVEKDITLSVTKMMQEMLEEQGINVVMTREADEYVGLEERTEISNKEDTDLFVSIHCNSYDDDDSVYGLECYYQEEGAPGQKYAEQIIEVLEEKGHVRSRGAKAEEYYVTGFTDAPAVLIEMGFLSNPTECANLNSSKYQKVLAEDMVEGILSCFTED